MTKKEIFKKYYPFWLGLFVSICLIGTFINTLSLAVIGAYLIGYFNIGKFHED